MNQELPDVQARFKKAAESEIITNTCSNIEKATEFQKNIYFCFIDYSKAFDWVDHNKLWKILKEMGLQDHFTCLLKNLYAGQEATVRTGHTTTDWFKIGKGVWQGCILSHCLFNLYREYIMQNVKCQAGWITNWNQDCWGKYQQPQICRWYHSNGRDWRRTPPWLRWWRDFLQCGRPGFDPWVRKIPWRREMATHSIFLLGKYHGQGAWQATVHRVAESQTRLRD